MIILAIAIISYYVAINVYGAMILTMQKKENEVKPEEGEKVDDKTKESGIRAEKHDESGKKDALSGDKKSLDKKGENESYENVIMLGGKTENATEDNIKQKENRNSDDAKSGGCFSSVKKVSDGQLFVTAALGGSLGMFLGIIITRYRLKNMPLMVGLPVISAVYIALIVTFFVRAFAAAAIV